jgi:hypothetical protein
MTPEQFRDYVTDGGQQLDAVPELEVRQVDPDKIAVDEMNERRDEALATEELEETVAKNGVVEPPVCRVRDEDAAVPYSVIQGQRRVAAAKAVQLDSIEILVGEFEDKDALIRSITENFSGAKKEVSTKSRAAAIWELWKLHEGEDCDPVPAPSVISDLLGVKQTTASFWIEPLRSEFAETAIDPRVNDDTNRINYDLSTELDDVGVNKLASIRQVASGEKAEQLVEQIISEDMSQTDVREVVERTDSETDPFEAIEQVKQEKEVAEQVESVVLDKLRFGSTTGSAISQAERATGKRRDELIKDAVEYYLREEGFL